METSEASSGKPVMQGADHLRELECSPVMRGDKSGDVPASDFAGQRVVEVVVDQIVAIRQLMIEQAGAKAFEKILRAASLGH